MTINSNMRINGERLWDSIMEMARIGPGVAGGNNRQTLTDEDAQGRRLFQRWCEEAGMTMGVDSMGTMFMTRPGEDTDALYYGHSIFSSAKENDPSVITDENVLLQGDLKRLRYADLRLRYTVNPANGLALELRASMRRLTPSAEAFDDTRIISFGITNLPFNNYQSF